MPEVTLMRPTGTGMSPGWLPLLAAAALSLGACSSPGPLSPTEASRQLDHDMFVTGLEDIDQVYISQPNIGAMAMAGMQQLSTLDPDVAARRTGDTVELLVGNKPVESIAVSDTMDAKKWGEVTADVLDTARAD